MVVVCMGGVGIGDGVVLDFVGKIVCGGGVLGVMHPRFLIRRDRTGHKGRRRLGSDVEARLLLDGDWMF